MKSLSAALILEKNKIASPNPWLITLDIALNDPSNTIIYLVKNTENITFQTITYTAFPFELDAAKEDMNGEIPTLTLRVSNITRALQAYLESLDGFRDATVTIRIINSANLSENYADLETTLDVLSTTSDVYWVTFTLGAPNPLRYRFPQSRYIASHCNWKFKGRECYYSDVVWAASTVYTTKIVRVPTTSNGHVYKCTTAGTSGSTEPTWPVTSGATVNDGTVVWTENGSNVCKRTFDECRRLNNTERYGGYIGISTAGTRFA